jgi:cellulose biosynthesis protein BcsQ
MPIDVREMRVSLGVPVLAFFGTKGGVGKTTIARRFAELVTLAPSSPNVLLVDSDVHHRGMTVEMTSHTPVSCKTVHDYIAGKRADDVKAADMTGLVRYRKPNSGRLYFIPASNPESARVFEESAKIGPELMLQILYEMVKKAVQDYKCRCVVIDCGPIIDPYTAAAAYLADRAFIIGQNEPISFSALKTYPERIRDFYPDFSVATMKVIFNKVRNWKAIEDRGLQEEIFSAIPFTLDIVDVSEGLAATNEMQLMLFEDHIVRIVEKVFEADHPELIPDRNTLLPPSWNELIQRADQLENAPQIKRLGMLRLLLPLGLLSAIIGAVIFYGASSERHKKENGGLLAELIQSEKRAIIAAGNDGRGVSQLEKARHAAEEAESSKQESVNQALKAAREAGLKDVPAVKQEDTTKENAGIGIALGGIALLGIGFTASQSRARFLRAIQGLRSKGAEWLMAEMKSKPAARKTFDRLLKMAKQV